jgi:hypothetical protein
MSGVLVLISHPGQSLLFFWLLLGGALLIPGPPGSWLLRAPRSVTAPAPALPAARSQKPTEGPVLGGPLTNKKHAPAATKPPKPNAPFDGIAIEDPHRSLRHVAAALAKTEAGKTNAGKQVAITRVFHYGDSQIDLDHITGTLRTLLQKKYGDAGLGYVPIVPPWRWYYLPNVKLKGSSGFAIDRLAAARRPDGHLGLGLTSFRARGNQWAQLLMHPQARVSKLELTYLEQPGGGLLTLIVDGKTVVRKNTHGQSKKVAFASVELDDKRHSFRVLTRGKVRLLGWALERSNAGITWENLPMIGGRFYRLTSVAKKSWQAQLQKRKPHLLVFQYGANDTIHYGGSIPLYRKQIASVMRQTSAASGPTSCLVISPFDQLIRGKNGRLVPRAALAKVLEAQRQAAFDARCAFWDARKAMGGPGSLEKWIKKRLVRRDMVHLNGRGSARIAHLFYQAFLHALKAHRPKAN